MSVVRREQQPVHAAQTLTSFSACCSRWVHAGMQVLRFIDALTRPQDEGKLLFYDNALNVNRSEHRRTPKNLPGKNRAEGSNSGGISSEPDEIRAAFYRSNNEGVRASLPLG